MICQKRKQNLQLRKNTPATGRVFSKKKKKQSARIRKNGSHWCGVRSTSTAGKPTLAGFTDHKILLDFHDFDAD